jgi:hypothetical protein
MCRPWGTRLKRERNEVCINPELELELIQTQMTQKPMWRAEVECANVAQLVRKRSAWVAKSLTKSEAVVGGAHSGNA